MNFGTSNRQARLDRFLRIVLMVTLLFAAWHVASHGVDIASGHEQCQVCRLSHVPIADLPVFAWLVPLILLSLVLIILTLQQPTQPYRYTLGARAPPLL